MFMITPDGVIVIEPVDVAHSEAMLAAIREKTDAPIKYALFSHNHWDHSKGGQVWKDEGAALVAHEEAAAYMRANPTDDLVVPETTWSGDEFEVTLGDLVVELHYLGLSHGNGMTTFVLPKQKVHCGLIMIQHQFISVGWVHS